MANRAGMNYKIQPTPAVALGAYEITPIEAAGAYTVFANGGDYVKPNFLRLVRANNGKAVFTDKPEQKPALDPRVAYLMTNLMEEVLRTGTAAGVRARYSLNFPAAGKTGTSHDGWFAGYTSELLCVVWVGFDDNRELEPGRRPLGGPYLGGVHETGGADPRIPRHEILQRARRDCLDRDRPAIGHARHAELSDAPLGGLYFRDAAGGGLPAARRRPNVITNVAGWDVAPPPASPGESAPRVTGSNGDGLVQPSPVARRAARQDAQQAPATAQPGNSPQEPKKTEKKGFFRRLMGVFK